MHVPYRYVHVCDKEVVSGFLAQLRVSASIGQQTFLGVAVAETPDELERRCGLAQNKTAYIKSVSPEFISQTPSALEEIGSILTARTTL